MRGPIFPPYETRPSGKCVEEVFADINARCFSAHGPDYRYGAERIIANPIQAYERFLGGLLTHHEPGQFLTFCDLLASPHRADEVQIVVRHDVDVDVVTALRMAELEHDLGLRTSYFFLHTGLYYGAFRRGVFHRNDCMQHVYRRIQGLGHEVSLHNDAMRVYQNWGVDGAAAVAEEIRWMRSAGLDVVGTVAHGSKPVYGAENYEIFKGSPFKPWEPTRRGDYKTKDQLCFRGKTIPLRTLDPARLGLAYEGNEAFDYGEGPVEYGATRFLNLWRWNRHIRRWEAHGRKPPVTYFCDQDRVVRDIQACEPGTLVILTVHPVYYGCRHVPVRGPARAYHRLRTDHNPRLGWETCVPETVQCGRVEIDHQAYQGMDFSNELGMLDRSWSQADEEASWRGLVLGGDNVHGLGVGVGAQCHAVLETLLAEHLDRSVAVRKLAGPDMGLARLWAWYRAVAETFRPRVVVLGLGGSVLQRNLPLLWSKQTGFSLTHPAGDYLAWDAKEGSVKLVSRSDRWAVHRMKPIPTWVDPQSDWDVGEAMAEGNGFEVDDCDCFAYVESLYRHCVERIRADGAQVLLLVEDLGTLPADGGRRAVFPGTGAARNVRERLAAMADRLDVPLVDPYGAFAASEPPLPAVDDEGRWTFTGHRLAGEAVFEALTRAAPAA